MANNDDDDNDAYFGFGEGPTHGNPWSIAGADPTGRDGIEEMDRMLSRADMSFATDQRREMEEVTKDKTAEINRLKEMMIKTDNKNGSLKKQLKSKGKQYEELKKRFDRLQQQASTICCREQELKEKLNSRKKKVDVLSKECEELKTRLGKFTSRGSTGDIMNIVGMSDHNSPKKLAERYKDLFDNGWTDAFATVLEHQERNSSTFTEDRAKKEAVGTLLGVLKEAWLFCRDELRRQGTPDHLRLPTLQDDFRKHQKREVAAHTADTLHRLSQLSTAQHEQDTYKKFLAQTKAIHNMDLSLIESYVKECVTLCWLMTKQDPEIVFELSAEAGDELDTNTYREYMKRELHIDFVILPPMLFHTKGFVLAKGVAHGKQSFLLETKGPPKILDKPRLSIKSTMSHEVRIKSTGKGKTVSDSSAKQEATFTNIDCVDNSKSVHKLLEQQSSTASVSHAPQADTSPDIATDDEYERYLKCLTMGYSMTLIKKALGDDAYERCKAIEKQGKTI